jgi:hypothetical protein
MSEEEKIEEQPVEEPAEQDSQDSDNVIFNALYAAAEEDPEEQEEAAAEPYSGPASIHTALAEEQHEEVHEEVQEEKLVEQQEPKPKSKAKIKRKIIDPEFARPQSPVQPKIVQQKKDPFIDSLLPEEKEAFKISQWAAQNVEGQNGLDQKYLDFFKKHKKFLEDNSDYDINDSDEYRKFLDTSKPKVDLKRFEKEMWTSEAEQRAIKKVQPEIMKLRRDQARIQGEPAAQGNIQKAKRILFGTIPEESKKIIQESGIQGLVDNNPIEAKIINESLSDAQGLVNVFYEIVHNVQDYDEKNPSHAALSNFISKEQDKFIKSGRTVKGGKTFVRRERMPLVPKAEIGKYYTFSDEDIVNLIALRAKESMSGKITGTRKALEKAGWSRGAQVASQQASPKVEQARKIQTPAPSRGVSAPVTQPKESNPILKLLDL